MDKPQITKRGWEITVLGEDEGLSRNEALKKAAEISERDKKLDETLEDSFPASDPPAMSQSDDD